MAEDIDIKVKQNKASITAVQQATARIENDIIVDDGLNVAGKAFLDSGVIEPSSDAIPSPWQIRANYTSSTGEDGGTVYNGFYEIYSPIAYYNGVGPIPVTIGGTSWIPAVGFWRSLSSIVKTAKAGTLYARFKIQTASETCDSVVLEFVEDGSTKSDAEEGYTFVDHRICVFYNSGIEPFMQGHIGTLAHSSAVGGNGLALGPMVVSGNSVVQYLGTWSVSGTGPAFIPAANSNGGKIIGASFSVEKVLVRDTAGNAINSLSFPNLLSGNANAWLTSQQAVVTKSVDYAAPGSELENGTLSATTSTITYFSSSGQHETGTKTLLTTVVEDANEATIYESEDGEEA